MTADRSNEADEIDNGAEDQLIAALTLYDESLDTDAAAAGEVTEPLDPMVSDRFTRLRPVLTELARLRAAETPRAMVADHSTDVVPTASPTADGAPRKIGRFTIVREIGRGGHGIVFLARDPALGRELALKVPRPELLMSESARKRFVREGRSTAALAHPNLVTVFEAGEAGPICYLAQEFCEGPNFDEWIRQQPQPVSPRQAAELVAQLAEGIEHAHRKGVVHRDLKPGNVLMQHTPPGFDKHGVSVPMLDTHATDATAWTPRIVDFGLARLDEGSETLTATGALLGTPAYMAPEQLEPSRGAVGPASDIYALGGMLYQTLANQPPFAGASQTELLKHILLDEPRSLRIARPDVPADLEAICHRALEKNPADRYVTAGDLAADLRRFLREEPTLARPLTRPEKLVRWARRKPWAAALMAVVVASFVGMSSMAAVYTVQLRAALAETERKRQEAEANRQLVRQQLYASDIRLAQDALNAQRAGECIDILRKQVPVGSDPDLREFAWGFLWHQTHQAFRELQGHRGGVYTVEYSPNGRLLVSAGEDGIVYVWETGTGRLRQRLAEHHSEVNAVSFSTDGQQLATVSDAGDLLLWSVGEQFTLSRRVAASKNELYAVRFAPDGERVAVGGEDGIVRIVSTTDGMIQRELSHHHAPVFALAYWDDGRRLVSGGKEGQLLDWDLAAETAPSPRILVHRARSTIRDVDFAPDEKRLVVARRTADVVQVPDGKIELRLGQGAEEFSAVAFSHDGQRLLAGNLDSTWRIGEWEQGPEAFRAVAGHVGRVYAAAISADDNEVATAGADGFVRQWSTTSAGIAYETTLDCPEAGVITFSACGDWLLRKNGAKEESLQLEAYAWRDETWQCVDQWTLPDVSSGKEICAISFDGRWIARSRGGPEVLLWQRDVSNDWTSIGTLDSRVGNLAFAPLGNVVLAANMDTVSAWQVSPPRLLWKATIPRSDVRTLTATSTVVACASGSAVNVFSLATGEKLFSTQLPSMEFLHVVVTADGSELIAAGSDRSIYRWSLPAGRPLEPWIGHTERVALLAAHPDGRTIASLDADLLMQLWHRPTGRGILTLREGRPETITFSSDGRFLHVAGQHSRAGDQIWSYRSSSPETQTSN